MICAHTHSTAFACRLNSRDVLTVCAVSEFVIPAPGSAEVHVLHNGYAGLDGDDERVAGTVSLIIDGDAVRDADRLLLSPPVRLLRTPGHTAEDISTVASAGDGVYACAHAWWGADGPAEDPLGSGPVALHASRELLLSFGTVIVPGRGPASRLGPDTPL
jgi:glyoxylase-like metal-dependent hydrolase (beta-lactamase superfamily II)